jgi:hypothetical protein
VDTLFEPFSLPQSQQAEMRDNGLGLALSKRLVEIMDGTLQSGNLADGGFRFVFVLPVRIPDAAEVVRLANNREFELLRRFGRIDQIGRSGVLGVEEPPL